MTEQQALDQAIEEIENEKPLYKAVGNETIELNESEYQQAILDRKTFILDAYNFGYVRSRQAAYLPLAEQLDMQYWDNVNGTTTWQDHIAEVKANNPKPA